MARCRNGGLIAQANEAGPVQPVFGAYPTAARGADLSTQDQIALVQGFIESQDRDVFLYTGPIVYEPACQFVDLLCRKENRRRNAELFLTTPGGDPHAAYRIVRGLCHHYGEIRLAVFGPCKSAGTLIAIGAHELVMAETGELGPLDVQITKPDEIVSSGSGLDIFQALAVITQSAFGTFEQYMLDIVSRSAGSISTKTAAEIARDFAVGLFTPITAQLDPTRLGEVQRAINIARAYGEKLGTPNLKRDALDTLVEGYPSHSFVIDLEEAARLFKRVSPPTDDERQVAELFYPVLRQPNQDSRFLDAGDVFKPDDAESHGEGENPRQQVREQHLPTRDDSGTGDSQSPESDAANNGGPATSPSPRRRRGRKPRQEVAATGQGA